MSTCFKILPNGTLVWIERVGPLDCYHAEGADGFLSVVSTVHHNYTPGEYARALELAAQWFREIEEIKRQMAAA